MLYNDFIRIKNEGGGMILVIAANSTICRMYDYNKKSAEIKLIREILHPENRLQNRELNSDRPGHYHGNQTSRGSYEPTDTKEIKIDNFSREIAKELNDERHKNGYDKFIVIAPPHVSGLINQHAHKLVKERIDNRLQKDVLHFTDKDLLAYLREHTLYEG